MSQKTAYIDSIPLVLRGVMTMCGPKLFSKWRKEISSFKKTLLRVYLYLLRETFFSQKLGFLFLKVMATGKISGRDGDRKVTHVYHYCRQKISIKR